MRPTPIENKMPGTQRCPGVFVFLSFFFFAYLPNQAKGVFHFKDWENSLAEISHYQAKSIYLAKEVAYRVTVVVEKRYRAPIAQVFSDKPLEKMDPVFQTGIYYQWQRAEGFRTVSITVQHLFQTQNSWLSQQTQLTDWTQSVSRYFTPQEKHLSVTEYSNWRTNPKIWTLNRSQVWTTEQLLVGLRQYNLSLPLDKPIYLLLPTSTDTYLPQIIYAKITSTGKKMRLNENDVYKVSVELENGKKMVLYYLTRGVRTLFRAVFIDGTTWDLSEVSWGKYKLFDPLP